MKTARKVTIELPERLLRKALESTGEGVTATIRRGLKLVASRSAAPARAFASFAYESLSPSTGVSFARIAADRGRHQFLNRLLQRRGRPRTQGIVTTLGSDDREPDLAQDRHQFFSGEPREFGHQEETDTR